MKLSYFGHSCFLVEIKGKKILFDPFISPNELAASIDVEKSMRIIFFSAMVMRIILLMPFPSPKDQVPNWLPIMKYMSGFRKKDSPTPTR